MRESLSDRETHGAGSEVAECHSAAAMRLQGIEGRVAVVTGAASGIGRCVAETLTAMGARVGGIDLCPGDVHGLAVAAEADVRDEAAVERAFDAIERELGPAELLVTSAGVFSPVHLDQLTVAEWTRTLDINLTGTFLCVKRAATSMRAAKRGRIVTIASGAGIDGGTEACAHYAASKGGVIVFTKAASKELAPHGVTVNCVAPRNISTAMIAELEDELASQVPVGRIGSVDDVAAAVVFLCSAHAAYVTGEVMAVNGGWW